MLSKTIFFKVNKLEWAMYIKFRKVEIDRYIGHRYWVLPIYLYRPKRPILSASVGVDKTLLYSSHIQTICARKHNEVSQDDYLTATLAGAVS